MRVVLVQAKHVNYGIAIEVRDKVVLPPLGRMVKCGVVVVSERITIGNKEKFISARKSRCRLGCRLS